jgi:hypothetical protein
VKRKNEIKKMNEGECERRKGKESIERKRGRKKCEKKDWEKI